VRTVVGPLSAVALGLVAGCGDATAPEEARFPVVEGIYSVETTVITNSCQAVNVIAGDQVFVFFQDGGMIEFRPPAFDEEGELVFLDLGIQGALRPDGRFAISGAYTLTPSLTGPGIVVGFTMEGRFTGNRIEGLERQLATFGAGSCEVTFAFEGEEV
jgi:hypothetical protein